MPNGPDALAGAKQALASANAFTKSVEGHTPSSFAPHETAHAPYAMAHKARQSGSSLADEAHSAGEGIKARMETEAATRKSLEQ